LTPQLPISGFGGIMKMPLSGKVKKSKDRRAFAALA